MCRRMFRRRLTGCGCLPMSAINWAGWMFWSTTRASRRASAPICSMPAEESFDELISTNLRGPYFLTQSVAAWMIRQRAKDPSAQRSIINISSVSATVASVNRGDYCISKAGIAMATKLWAVRLAEYGIGVYEVRPGIIETDMTEGVKGKYDALIEGGILLEKRWGTPKDVGTAVSMLARGELPYATGAVLVLDGGLTMARL